MYKILTFDDKTLLKPSSEIKEINSEIVELSNEMFKSMYYSQNGIGLAAIQIGVPKRMFVLDIPEIGKYTIINPKIMDKSVETQKFEEGCLSLPGIASEVERSREIVLEYLDLEGNLQKLDAGDFLSTVIQHEYDHLDGILFIDRLAPDIRLLKLKEYKELRIV